MPIITGGAASSLPKSRGGNYPAFVNLNDRAQTFHEAFHAFQRDTALTGHYTLGSSLPSTSLKFEHDAYIVQYIALYQLNGKLSPSESADLTTYLDNTTARKLLQSKSLYTNVPDDLGTESWQESLKRLGFSDADLLDANLAIASQNTPTPSPTPTNKPSVPKPTSTP